MQTKPLETCKWITMQLQAGVFRAWPKKDLLSNWLHWLPVHGGSAEWKILWRRLDTFIQFCAKSWLKTLAIEPPSSPCRPAPTLRRRLHFRWLSWAAKHAWQQQTLFPFGILKEQMILYCHSTGGTTLEDVNECHDCHAADFHPTLFWAPKNQAAEATLFGHLLHSFNQTKLPQLATDSDAGCLSVVTTHPLLPPYAASYAQVLFQHICSQLSIAMAKVHQVYCEMQTLLCLHSED